METEVQSIEGVSPESSSSTPDSTASNEVAQAASPSKEAGSEASKPNSQSENTPFHEHPRFKELIEQRNQFQTAMQDMQRRLSEYETRQQESKPKEETSEDKMLKRLESVDPEFAAFMKSIYGKLPKVDQLEQQWQQSQQEAQRTAVQSQVQALHEQYKVPSEQRDLYRSLLKAHVSDIPNAQASDLPKYYKAVHDSVSKMMEGIKRAERASYVTAKKADSATPSTQQRSAAPKTASQAKKPDYSRDPDAGKREMISRVMQDLRATKQ